MGIFSPFSANANLKSGKKLMEAAAKAQGEEADRLLKQACTKFELVVNGGSRVLDGLHHWGLALHGRAKLHEGQDAENLFNEAYTKYNAALVIEPRNHEVLNDWGATMMDHARKLGAEPNHVLYQQAKEKFLAAEGIWPGISSYNLACIASLQNDLKSCEEHLNLAHQRGNLPPIEQMRSDADLANINQSEWFQDFVDSIPV
ncbi:MAG: TPR end-of-group domain-containing protein [Gammaproteobacteria bacterium]